MSEEKKSQDSGNNQSGRPNKEAVEHFRRRRARPGAPKTPEEFEEQARQAADPDYTARSQKSPQPSSVKAESEEAASRESSTNPEEVRRSTPYPWEAPGVRSDRKEPFSLHLHEDYMEKIRWLAGYLPDSQQEIVRKCLYGEIDALVERVKARMEHLSTLYGDNERA